MYTSLFRLYLYCELYCYYLISTSCIGVFIKKRRRKRILSIHSANEPEKNRLLKVYECTHIFFFFTPEWGNGENAVKFIYREQHTPHWICEKKNSRYRFML